MEETNIDIENKFIKKRNFIKIKDLPKYITDNLNLPNGYDENTEIEITSRGTIRKNAPYKSNKNITEEEKRKKLNEICLRHYHNNKEKIREYRREYYQKIKEQQKEKALQYYYEHKEELKQKRNEKKEMKRLLENK
jgi:hypothetical protein